MIHRSLVPLVALLGFLAPATAREPVDLELVLAVDVSGSIDPQEARLQRDGYVAALTDRQVVSAITSGIHGKIAVTYLEWASWHQRWTLLEWTEIGSQETAEAVAAKLSETPITIGFRTSISAAIDFAMTSFDKSPFEGIRRVIDISGDGPNNDGGLVSDARDKALAAGVVINGLPVINDRPNRFGFPTMQDLDRYYDGCVIGGPGAFVIKAESFHAFAAAVRQKLIMEIAGLQPPGPQFAAAGLTDSQLAQGRPDYPGGCDIGERQSRDYYRGRWEN